MMGADIVLALKVGISVLGSQAAPTLSVTPTDSVGFLMAEISKGTGIAAKTGDRITVEFSVTTLDGKELANTTRRGLAYTVVLGDPSTNSLFQLALDGVKQGSERRIVFPVEDFFGSNGALPVLPHSGQLQGTIRVLKVVRPSATAQAVLVKGRG